MKRSWGIVLLCAALPWTATGADAPEWSATGTDNPVSAAAGADDLERAESLYALYCAQCHGSDGTGDGLNAPYMDTRPRDHTNRSEMGGRSDDELFRTIAEGGQAMNLSVMMPPWEGSLDEDEIAELVRYLRVLCCQE